MYCSGFGCHDHILQGSWVAARLQRRASMTSKLSRLALATATGLVCLFINDSWSSTEQSTLITPANARIGHPLTPGSIAGVNRRVERRAYRRGYYGGGYYGYGRGYYRPGLGLAAGAALGTGAGHLGRGYYGRGVTCRG